LVKEIITLLTEELNRFAFDGKNLTHAYNSDKESYKIVTSETDLSAGDDWRSRHGQYHSRAYQYHYIRLVVLQPSLLYRVKSSVAPSSRKPSEGEGNMYNEGSDFFGLEREKERQRGDELADQSALLLLF